MTELCSLKEILKRLSDHFDGLATEVFHIEHALGGEIDRTVPNDPEIITRLQRLDFLRQTLEDVAILMLRLSKAHDGALDPKLMSKVRLDSTKDLLASVRNSPAVIINQDTVGDVDLF